MWLGRMEPNFCKASNMRKKCEMLPFAFGGVGDDTALKGRFAVLLIVLEMTLL